MSRYAGLRVTLTTDLSGREGFVSIQAKYPTGGWDEWTSLVPSERVLIDEPVSSSREALEQLLSQVTQALERL